MVVKKWSNIRDAFVRAERKLKNMQKSAAGTKHRIKKYVYADQLQFLVAARSRRSTDDSITLHENEDTSYSNVSVTINEAQGEELSKVIRHDEICNLGSRKQAKLDSVEQRMFTFLERTGIVKTPPNRHLSFFEGIVPSLETFSDDEVLCFQAGLLKLIMDIKKNKKSTKSRK